MNGTINTYGEVFNDERRVATLQPGHLVYSVKLDQKKVECHYCCNKPYCYGCLWCGKETAAARTFMDIYTNGIVNNAPEGSCFMCWQNSGRFVSFDDTRFSNVGKAGCCTPFPWCCPHWCNCCGEVIYLKRGCACCMDQCPTGFGHEQICCPIGLGLFSCCIVELFYGLPEGEAGKVDEIILRARQGQALPLPRPTPWAMAVAQPTAVVMGQPQQQPAQYSPTGKA